MKIYQHHWMIGLIGLLAWCTLSSDVAAEDKTSTVIVRGEALIFEDDIPQARQRAQQEAFSAALTQIMGSYISAESYTRNYESIERGVYAKTRGYVKRYQILDEAIDDGLLTLTAQVTVSTKAMLDDLTALGIVLNAMGNPILVVHGEDEGLNEAQSVKVFKQRLVEQGFQVLDLNHEDRADVVMRLEGRIRSGSSLGGLQGAVVSLNASAYWQEGNRLIASAADAGNGGGLTETDALKAAYGQAAEALYPEFLQNILAKWQDEINNGRPIEIVLTVKNYRQMQTFQDRLVRIFGVKSVVLKNFAGNKANMIANFAGTADLLAQLITRTDFGNFSAEVREINAGGVFLVLDGTD